MAALVYAGIPEQDTVGIIKAISKKQIAKINAAKESFINGFTKKCGSESASLKIWQVMENSARYSSVGRSR